jgi:hypothetical protein
VCSLCFGAASFSILIFFFFFSSFSVFRCDLVVLWMDESKSLVSEKTGMWPKDDLYSGTGDGNERTRVPPTAVQPPHVGWCGVHVRMYAPLEVRQGKIRQWFRLGKVSQNCSPERALAVGGGISEKDPKCREIEDDAERLARGTLGALLVAAAGAGGADDNHATALATVLVGGHVDDVWCFVVCVRW